MGTRTPGSFSNLMRTAKGFTKIAIKNELRKEEDKLATLVAGAAPLHHTAIGKGFLIGLHAVPPVGLLGAIAVGGYAIYKGVEKYEKTNSVREAAKAAGITPEKIVELSGDIVTAHTEIKNYVARHVSGNIKTTRNIEEIKTMVNNILGA